jgi:hypothetical protein
VGKDVEYFVLQCFVWGASASRGRDVCGADADNLLRYGRPRVQGSSDHDLAWHGSLAHRPLGLGARTDALDVDQWSTSGGVMYGYTTQHSDMSSGWVDRRLAHQGPTYVT